MAAKQQVRIYATDGTLLNVIDQWRNLTLQRRINDFSTYQLSIDMARSNKYQSFTKDCFVEVLRCDPQAHLDWYQEFIGFHRTPQREITTAGNRLFTSYGRSLEDLLRRRAIAYSADTTYTYKGTPSALPADNIMKAFVRENIGELADNPSRLLPGRIPNWVTAEDSSQAPLWSGARAYKNLLDVLQEIGASTSNVLATQFQSTSVDFKVTMLSMSPPTFLFSTAYPMIGTDRTLTNPPLIFSEQRDNITDMTYTNSATEEITVAIVAGSGLGDRRTIVIDKNVGAVDESPWNQIELVRDDRNSSDVTALTRVARSVLSTQGAQESFKFTPRQTGQYIYGRDYHLGDKVYVQTDDIIRPKRLTSVTLSSSGDANEQLTLDFTDLIPSSPHPQIEAIRWLSMHLSYVEHNGDI